MIDERQCPGTRRAPFFALVVLLALSVAVEAMPAVPSRDWTEDMAKFDANDKSSPAPDGCVLFVGSSSIRLWTSLAEDYAGVAVLNRGFGGSQIADSIVNFGHLVAPHNPRLIVFYAGTNDIASDKTPEEVAADFREFCTMVHAAKPEVRIAFVSLQFAPARWQLREKLALTNIYVSRFCASDPRLTYVETNNLTMTADGHPRPELYVADRLHMNADGYAIWAKLLRPIVESNGSAN